MSMDQLMALVPIEAATTLTTTTAKGRKSRWERCNVAPRGKSRFGPKDDRPYLPPPFVDLPPSLTPLQFLREQRLDELTSKLDRGELEFGDPDIRAPSPPPAYDKNGNRTNTRDVRVRNAMSSEHQRLLEYMTSTVVGFVPPNDYKPVKKIRRIIIPQEKFPEYNFMGLIIGPRGCNHKRLESESGAQISIRGRGTQKEGKKTDHQTEEEAAMPQHIHIAADTEESLDKAVSLIEPLLNPHHPAHEEFKKKGLEQLALVNGVSLTKLETRCAVCGAVGHLSWECPDTDFQNFQRADVKCALCGDKGHVTMDCKLAKSLSSEQLAEIEKKTQSAAHASYLFSGGSKGATIPPPPRKDSSRLDMEYSQMMSEISGRARSGVETSDGYTYKGNTHSAFSYMRPVPPPPQAPSVSSGSGHQQSMADYSAYYNAAMMNGGAYAAYPAYADQFAQANLQQQMSAQDAASFMNAAAMDPTAMWNSMAAGMDMSGLTSQQQMDQMSQMMMAMYPMLMMGYGMNPAGYNMPDNSAATMQSAIIQSPDVVQPPIDEAPPMPTDAPQPPPADEELPPWQQPPLKSEES